MTSDALAAFQQSPAGPAGDSRYYDPAGVDAYIAAATTTISELQDKLAAMLRLVAAAEHGVSSSQADTMSLGRALLLTSEVADKIIADADVRAEEITAAANAHARSVVAAAATEAGRIIGQAQTVAAEILGRGEERLLDIVLPLAARSELVCDEWSQVYGELMSRRPAAAPDDGQDDAEFQLEVLPFPPVPHLSRKPANASPSD